MLGCACIIFANSVDAGPCNATRLTWWVTLSAMLQARRPSGNEGRTQRHIQQGRLPWGYVDMVLASMRFPLLWLFRHKWQAGGLPTCPTSSRLSDSFLAGQTTASRHGTRPQSATEPSRQTRLPSCVRVPQMRCASRSSADGSDACCYTTASDTLGPQACLLCPLEWIPA